jgi:hypothetical protein
MLAMLKRVIYPDRLPLVLIDMLPWHSFRQLVYGTGDASQLLPSIPRHGDEYLGFCEKDSQDHNSGKPVPPLTTNHARSRSRLKPHENPQAFCGSRWHTACVVFQLRPGFSYGTPQRLTTPQPTVELPALRTAPALRRADCLGRAGVHLCTRWVVQVQPRARASAFQS